MRRLLALTTFACLFSVSSQVMAQDQAPVVTAPASASVNENSLLTILVTATDPDGDAITSFTASGTVMTAGATFAANGTNTSGTLSWTPTFTQSGSFSAIFTASNALSGSASTTILIGGPDRAPVVTAPATALVNEGSLLTINVTAADPDGEGIASLTASGAAITAGATFSAGAGNGSGTLSWTPTFTQAGTYSVTFTASNSLTGTATTSITVAGDSPPVVTAPAFRLACENALLTFTVGATDPDGDAITSLTASGTVMTAGATFTAGPGNTSGTLNWTPSFTAAGSYAATFTAQNALSGSASTAITVGDAACDRAPVVTAPATASVNEGSLLTINVTASDPDGQAITSLTAFGSAITAGATFSAGPMNTSGTLSWTPTFTQAGTYSVRFTASNSLTGFATTSINVGPQGGPPVVTAPVVQNGCVGLHLSFTVGAADPDGEAIASLTASGSAITLGGTFTSGADNTSGTFSWTPATSGSFHVTFTASNAQSGSASTAITVDCGVLPAVTAPATASVTEGSLLTFTVTASEPDGPALVSLTASGTAIDAGAAFTAGAPGGSSMSGTFDWTPTLTQAGTYSVTFTATSNNPGTASTSITVADADGPLAARAFTSNASRTIRLASGKAFWCASIEPIGGSFDVANIVPTSVVLISPGTGSVSQISAVSGKGVVVGDADRNDIEDVTYCFRKEDLRLLFSDVHGKTTLEVTLAGSLTSGRGFSAALSVEVIGSGGGQAVSVAPNPFNPSGVLSIVSTRSGTASIRIFDYTGRLVRTLEEGTLSAGRHDVRIDGRDESGRQLATGIYFYRVALAEGTLTGRFAILK